MENSRSPANGTDKICVHRSHGNAHGGSVDDLFNVFHSWLFHVLRENADAKKGRAGAPKTSARALLRQTGTRGLRPALRLQLEGDPTAELHLTRRVGLCIQHAPG